MLSIRKLFGLLILKIIGWNIKGNIPRDVKKCVMIIAPHTSTLDFFIGSFAFWFLKLRVKILIKKEFFVFPFGLLLKASGGYPVNRASANSIVNEAVELIHKSRTVVIAITPEGTRKYTNKWKKGFYLIALRAKVPIALAYLNYKKKEGGVGEMFYPTGDFEKDFKYIEDFYRKIASARHPENFNLTI